MNYILTEEQLRELLEAKNTLEALEIGGVDNWDWYGESLRDFNVDEAVENELKEYKKVE